MLTIHSMVGRFSEDEDGKRNREVVEVDSDEDGNLLRSWKSSDEGSLLRDFSSKQQPNDQMSKLLMDSAVPSQRPASAVTNHYRPAGSKMDIGVCLYGPSRAYLSGVLSKQAVELAKATGHSQIGQESHEDDKKEHDDSQQDDKEHDVKKQYDSQLDENNSAHKPVPEPTESMPLEDAVANDPRWTDRDGWPRLAPRYEHGLQDIGSLTSQSQKQPQTQTQTQPETLSSAPQHVIDVNALRRIASQGISDRGSHRAVAWRVLLGYLPAETIQWETTLKKNRTLYRQLVAELFVKPTSDLMAQAQAAEHQYQISGGPSPYTPSSDGFVALVPARIREQWKAQGRHQILESHLNNHIRRTPHNSHNADSHVNALLVVDDDGYTPSDTARQHRISLNDNALPLTSSSGHRSKKPPVQPKTNTNTIEHDEEYKWNQFFENAALLDEIRKDVVRTHPDLHFFLEPEDNLGQRRYAALERILFVWAKLNRGVRYVQGMNEIVGTIYFVLANDPNEEWAAEAEADTYALFNVLMMEIRDVFVPDLDQADTGIQGRIANMMQLLSLHDPEVRCHLTDVGIDASFYSIRWLTTLLSREFTLPDTIRLWDSMFASTHKDNFLRYVCVTMVMMIRAQLLQGDFSVCLRLLQQYPPTNVDRMLESSRSLWIYESQITLACHRGGISLGQALNTIDPPPGVIMAYGLKGGRTAKKLYVEDTASSIGHAGRRFLGSVVAAGRGWAARRNPPSLEETADTTETTSQEELEEQQRLKQEALEIARKADSSIRRSETI